MNFLELYWPTISLIIITLCIVGYVAFLIYTKQVDKLQKWLLLAVTIAEKELQSKTGRLKLEFVYDMFKDRFAWLHLIMPRETFESLVDQALAELRHLLETNEAVYQLIVETVAVKEDSL